MTTALVLHLTVKPVTGWLFLAAGILVILGPVLAVLTGPYLEIGAFMPWAVCWGLALALALVAAGSLL